MLSKPNQTLKKNLNASWSSLDAIMNKRRSRSAIFSVNGVQKRLNEDTKDQSRKKTDFD